MCTIAAALSLSAVSASGAQALNWATAEEGTPYVLSGGASKSTSGSASFGFASTIGKFSVEVVCSASSTSGSITAGGGGTTTASLSGCVVSEPESCEVSPITLQAKTELINVGGTTYEKFVPVKGGIFGTVEFKGSKCALNELPVDLSGAFAGLPPQSERVVERKLTLSNSINKTVGVEVKFGTNTAVVGGSITEHLSSAPAGSSWRSLWEGTHGGWEIQEVIPQALKSSESVQFSGAPFEFGFNYFGTAVSVNCSEESTKSATLVPGGTEEVTGLTLSGCTVSHPLNCGIAGNSLSFTPLVGTLKEIGGKIYETFKAKEAGGALFGLSFTGSSCSLGEKSWSVGGSFAGLGSEYGFPNLSQSLAFSKANNEVAGSGLTIGTSVGWLNGTVNEKLVGVLAGWKWEVF